MKSSIWASWLAGVVPVYWVLSCCRSVCYSIYALRSVPDDELALDDSNEVYTENAREFRFSILGCVDGEEPEKDFAEFREDVGTLQDERWKCLKCKKATERVLALLVAHKSA